MYVYIQYHSFERGQKEEAQKKIYFGTERVESNSASLNYPTYDILKIN